MTDYVKQRLLAIEFWVYGLISGFIGGGATAAISAIGLIVAHGSGIDVPTLNFKAIGVVFLSAGLTTALAYLAKSPLPPLPGPGGSLNAGTPASPQPNDTTMKKIIGAVLIAGLLALGTAQAQTPVTNTQPVTATNSSQGFLTDLWTAFSQSGMAQATNYAIEPYATYAPDIHKAGGGVFAAYNINDYLGTGLGVDYCGQLSIVSANVQLKYPLHPFGSTSLTLVPFVLAGVGKSYSGAAGNPIAITDLGMYAQFGEAWGGKFNVGVAYGRWDNAGPYSGTRYHFFLGWSKAL